MKSASQFGEKELDIIGYSIGYATNLTAIVSHDFKAAPRTRTIDDCGVGTIDRSKSEYIESTVAGINAGRTDCKTWTGASDVVFAQ